MSISAGSAAVGFSSANAAFDHLDLVRARRVVRVDLGRLAVRVPEELLNRPNRLAGCGETGAEGVAKVVKAHGAHTGLSARGLEALGHLAAIERLARQRMGEDEVVISAVRGAARPGFERAGGAVGHRDRTARGEVRLAIGGMLAPHERVADADSLGSPIGVAPAEAEELALPKARQCRNEDQHAKDRPQHVGRRRRSRSPTTAPGWSRLRVDDLVGDRADHRLELFDAEELQVGLASPWRRRPGRAARRTGFSRIRRRSIAYSKIDYRNVMTLRTVFGASPLSSIDPANHSMWLVVISVTGLLPMRGEMWTRCIDSQPSR